MAESTCMYVLLCKGSLAAQPPKHEARASGAIPISDLSQWNAINFACYAMV